ncbi:hypothetical protein [Polluticaenibacter yanchengensis]|uniref:Tetratricopeptide repeat protein n=1 Tax=Polluticaenibacter yanchengensis TaxID=3014562 RepID=A0ABT4UIV9_9BACT|nr:hypothetical protein [Chitinophagaceae bacterium LY-5]
MNLLVKHIVNLFSKLAFLALLFVLFAGEVQAQKEAKRYEIDAKRAGVSPTDKDALPRGREFIRLDSTYYVGWLYQGMYLYDRSVDAAGYARCLPLVRKAFLLLEKDFGNKLKSIFDDPYVYYEFNQRFSDYLMMASTLREVYENLNKADSAMWIVNAVAAKNFRRDFFNVAGTKAWIIHRNRFYTKSKYAFLGNSVQENEKLAFNACYEGFARIKRNASQNNLWFGEQHATIDRNGVYHYLALLHSYNKNYDSSEYYYKQMLRSGYISFNNYGSLKLETGFFAKSYEYYSEDKYKYGQDKHLMEPYYYLPILDVFANRTKNAIDLAREAINYSKSSPGFGWYNLAIGRSYIYNGQLDSGFHAIDKAANFSEVHIGTTLTQPQYEFTASILKLLYLRSKVAQVQFLNRNWWYSPSVLYDVTVLKASLHTQEFLVANQLAENPERARIYYDLFCGESTVTWDEVGTLMIKYSPKFFIKMMDEYLKSDPRDKIRRYFELMKIRLMWRDGDKREAHNAALNLLANTKLDVNAEKLFLYRLYEQLAISSGKYGTDNDVDFYMSSMIEQYSTLVPTSDVKPKVYLNITGDNDGVIADAVKQLKNANLNLQSGPVSNGLNVRVNIIKRGIKYEAKVSSEINGNEICKNEKFLFRDAVTGGEEIVLRMFGSKGAPEVEAKQNNHPNTKK